MTELLDLPLDAINPHPDNPRLLMRADVIESVAAEIKRTGFGREHAVLVRPHAGRHQLISGHHRIEAARLAGLAVIPAWSREMGDDEAYMQLVLCNRQGELRRIEHAVHVYRYAMANGGRNQGGRGKVGGLAKYARDVDRKQPRVNEDYAVGEVVETYRTSDTFMALVERDPYSQLLEISKAPSAYWPVLVDRMLGVAEDDSWSVRDTSHYVQLVKQFNIPDEWHWWLPPATVIRRFLATKEFSPQTVAKLITAATQVHEWVDANTKDPESARADFKTWLTERGEAVWQPREVGAYLQRLIAAQFVVEGWHQGNWRDHLDKLDDGTVTLLLTDPPYGMGYQSDYRLDRRVDRKHDTIAADETPEAAMDEMLTALQAFWPKLAEDSHVLLFCGWSTELAAREIVEKAGYTLRGSLVWDKQATGMGDPTTTFAPAHERILHAVKGSPPLYHRAADLLSHRRADSSRHPTEKPEALLTELIEATTVEGQIVADPFGGVASTPAAAKAASRRWFGCELDDKYWAIGEERLLA